MNDDSRWWLYLPPCRECGESHVLTDCARRLPWEVAHIRVTRRSSEQLGGK